MSRHRRREIREAVVRQIGTSTSCGTRVFDAWPTAVWDISYPAAFVYCNSERAEPMTDQVAGSTRTVEVAVDLMAVADDQVAGVLDNLALEIETRINSDQTLGGKAVRAAYTGTRNEILKDGKRPIGIACLTYDVLYRDE